MTKAELLLIFSTLMGPIVAVAATRIVDVLRDRAQRRYDIFLALMATRRARLNSLHVEALNKIEVEFANNTHIIVALRRYMDLLEEPTSDQSTPSELIFKRRNRSFAELIQAIGKKLGRRIDKNDFIEGGYFPQGWAEMEELQLANMREINKILNFEKALPVLTQTYKPKNQLEQRNSKYPPPPGG